MRWRPTALSGLAMVLALVLPACAAEPPTPVPREETIRFASYDFAENQILVEVYAEAARRADLPVAVQHGIGTREVVSPALQQGVVEVVVDYLGTALEFVQPGSPNSPRNPSEMHDRLVSAMGQRDVVVLEHARAQDQNGFAVTTDFAAEEDLVRLSDLVVLAPSLIFGGPPECPDRPFCLQGLEEVYGIEFGAVLSMPSRAATVEALQSGIINVGLLETTDARLAVAPIQLLTDDRGLQPPENVVPLVSAAAVDRWGEDLRAALDEVSARLTTQDLVELNRAVEIDGLTPAEAAARWWG